MKQDKLLTPKDLAELLNVKLTWVKCMVFKGILPTIKVGKHNRFCPKQIEKWIEERKIQEDSWN